MADDIDVPVPEGTTEPLRFVELSTGKKVSTNRLDVGVGGQEDLVEAVVPGHVPVSGPVTDTELRATPVPVAGVITVAAAINPGDTVSIPNTANGTQALAADGARNGFSLTPDADCTYLLGSGNVTSSSPKLFAGQPLQFPMGNVNYTGEVKMLSLSGTPVIVSRWTV